MAIVTAVRRRSPRVLGIPPGATTTASKPVSPVIQPNQLLDDFAGYSSVLWNPKAAVRINRAGLISSIQQVTDDFQGFAGVLQLPPKSIPAIVTKPVFKALQASYIFEDYPGSASTAWWYMPFVAPPPPIPPVINIYPVLEPPKLLNRAQMRDAIRRKLNITPPIDAGTGNAGDQPVNRGNPSNQQMNDAIQESVHSLNRRCNFHVNNNINVPVPAINSSVLGPYEINLQAAAVQSNPNLDLATINDVRRAEYIDSSATYYRLEPTDYRELGLQRTDYKATPPGTPRQYWLEGYKLYVYPAQSVSGVVNLICGTGLLAFRLDTDTLTQIPLDYQDVIQYMAIDILMSGQTMDKEAKERRAIFSQLAENGILDIYRWKNGNNGEYQPSFKVATYRSGPESLRNRR